MEELVLGDLCRDLSILPSDVLKMGYYECHRVWLIFDELKARDLQHLHQVLDAAQSDEEYRKSVWGWLQGRQPRSNPAAEALPQDLQDRIRAAWAAEGGKLDG